MSYLVMECHEGYAVVLDNDGRFIKVANLNYEIGQRVFDIIEMQEVKDSQNISTIRKWVLSAASLAACLCMLFFGAWQYLYLPCGTVEIRINPAISISVNRLDYAVGLEGINEDGKILTDGYSYKRKKVDLVVDELADRAVELGYLSEGGTIHLTAESKRKNWKTDTENRLRIELEKHLKNSVTITSEPVDQNGRTEQSDRTNQGTSSEDSDRIVIPVKPEVSPSPVPKPSDSGASTGSREDDDQDDDDYDDQEDDDNQDDHDDQEDDDNQDDYDDQEDDSQADDDDLDDDGIGENNGDEVDSIEADDAREDDTEIDDDTDEADSIEDDDVREDDTEIDDSQEEEEADNAENDNIQEEADDGEEVDIQEEADDGEEDDDQDND